MNDLRYEPIFLILVVLLIPILIFVAPNVYSAKHLSNAQRHSDGYANGGRIRKLKVFNDINDYLRIDDFYSKLAERNSYINNNQAIDDIAMVKLNKKCLDLAEDALEKIDWSKYK